MESELKHEVQIKIASRLTTSCRADAATKLLFSLDNATAHHYGITVQCRQLLSNIWTAA